MLTITREAKMLNSELSIHGVTKLQRYKWTVKDAPGELMWLNKTDLEVDHSYQRDAKHNRVLQIASSWSWLACGVIVVAKRRDDNRLYVVDGQHRVSAAMKRSDIEKMPCLVFETEGAKEEAAGFYDANTGRKLPSGYEKWRAQLIRGDETTVFVDSLIRQAGRVPGEKSRPGEIRCLNTLLTAATSNRANLVKIWPLLIEISNGHPLHERVVEGLLYIETNIQNGMSLTEKRWRDRITRVGYLGLLDAAQRASAFYSYGGKRVWALGMLEAINKGCRILLTLNEAISK